MMISSLSCTAENGEQTETEKRSADVDPTSRSISPQKEYTKDKPSEWKAIADDHLPEIIFNESKTKDNVTVRVLGRKFSERHYIEVIGLMDERSADIDMKYLERGASPTVILTLNKKDYDSEKVKVFVKCNLHDLWTVPLIPESE